MSDLTTQQITAKAVVFDRLGNIVRSLHDALREIGAEKALVDAVLEFPSARERLLHIGELTEKAANTVLSKVEEVSPIQDRLSHKARELQASWDAETVPEALRPLLEQTTQFMADVNAGCQSTRGALSDMMMAQDFQDLTGQLIKKVVSLLESTENDLLKLLIEAAPPGSVPSEKKDEMMAGPGAPGYIALDQGDVDDLLADLGF